ncbi:MAG: hypothetical protein A3J38_04155 [Gammaproteobacteria bacterium RIFCSPHIGHO2_12_FULL_45_9]|nr:MAG: hypothetical protein A3J38_04155 [Gammaproteobacteria bacterium RIFCSPHIGHO2_12_FULL_45_9]
MKIVYLHIPPSVDYNYSGRFTVYFDDNALEWHIPRCQTPADEEQLYTKLAIIIAEHLKNQLRSDCPLIRVNKAIQLPDGNYHIHTLEQATYTPHYNVNGKISNTRITVILPRDNEPDTIRENDENFPVRVIGCNPDILRGCLRPLQQKLRQNLSSYPTAALVPLQPPQPQAVVARGTKDIDQDASYLDQACTRECRNTIALMSEVIKSKKALLGSYQYRDGQLRQQLDAMMAKTLTPELSTIVKHGNGISATIDANVLARECGAIFADQLFAQANTEIHQAHFCYRQAIDSEEVPRTINLFLLRALYESARKWYEEILNKTLSTPGGLTSKAGQFNTVCKGIAQVDDIGLMSFAEKIDSNLVKLSREEMQNFINAYITRYKESHANDSLLAFLQTSLSALRTDPQFLSLVSGDFAINARGFHWLDRPDAAAVCNEAVAGIKKRFLETLENYFSDLVASMPIQQRSIHANLESFAAHIEQQEEPLRQIQQVLLKTRHNFDQAKQAIEKETQRTLASLQSHATSEVMQRIIGAAMQNISAAFREMAREMTRASELCTIQLQIHPEQCRKFKSNEEITAYVEAIRHAQEEISQYRDSAELSHESVEHCCRIVELAAKTIQTAIETLSVLQDKLSKTSDEATAGEIKGEIQGLQQRLQDQQEWVIRKLTDDKDTTYTAIYERQKTTLALIQQVYEKNRPAPSPLVNETPASAEAAVPVIATSTQSMFHLPPLQPDVASHTTDTRKSQLRTVIALLDAPYQWKNSFFGRDVTHNRDRTTIRVPTGVADLIDIRAAYRYRDWESDDAQMNELCDALAAKAATYAGSYLPAKAQQLYILVSQLRATAAPTWPVANTSALTRAHGRASNS